jgi:hypothetical protein
MPTVPANCDGEASCPSPPECVPAGIPRSRPSASSRRTPLRKSADGDKCFGGYARATVNSPQSLEIPRMPERKLGDCDKNFVEHQRLINQCRCVNSISAQTSPARPQTCSLPCTSLREKHLWNPYNLPQTHSRLHREASPPCGGGSITSLCSVTSALQASAQSTPP